MKMSLRGSLSVAIATAGLAASLIVPASASAAIGSGAKGDLSLVTPAGATVHFGGSSFSKPFVDFLTTGNNVGSYVALNKTATFGTDSGAGSGDGRTGVSAGTYDIGFSDQPMNVLAGTAPTGYTSQTVINQTFTQVPLALGGAVVAYNLAGITGLKLSANIIGSIYNGKITKWDDDAILALNPVQKTALMALNNKTITVLYRNSSSGTTFAFTQYLNQATHGLTPGASGSVMEGTGNAWKATTVSAVAGNSGMASTLNSTAGAIGYVEYSYLLVPGNKLITASLQDANGEWLQPSLTNIAAAATAAAKTISVENFSINFEPGKGVWPLATYSWAIVKTAQTNAANGELAVKFLAYAIVGGQLKASANGYVPLSATVQKSAIASLMLVKSGASVLLTAKK